MSKLKNYLVLKNMLKKTWLTIMNKKQVKRP